MPLHQRVVRHSAMPTVVTALDRGHPLIRRAFMALVTSQNTAYMVPYFNGTNLLGGYGIAGVSKLATPFGRVQKRSGGGYRDDIVIPSTVSIDADGGMTWTCFWSAGSCAGVLMRAEGSSGQVDGRVDLNADGSLTMLANGNVNTTTAAGVVGDGLHTLLMLNNRTSGEQRLWLDGVQVASASSTAQKGYFSDRILVGQNATGQWGSFYVGMSLGSDGDVAARLLADEPFGIFAPRRSFVPVSAAGGGDVSLALTGQGGSFSQGVFTLQRETPVAGQSATFSAGLLGASLTIPLTGVSSTFAQGSVVPSVAVALIGLSATAAQGSPAASITLALTGQAGTFATGTVTASTGDGATLVGQGGTFSQGSPGVSITVALTGITATLATGIVSAASGSATITLKAGSWLRYKKLI